MERMAGPMNRRAMQLRNTPVQRLYHTFHDMPPTN
jgi:hypothetical protein